MVNKKETIFTQRHENVWFCTKCTTSIFAFNNMDDDEYYETIFDMQSTNPPIPFDILSSHHRMFTPFELNEDLSLPLIDS